jgi:hypothetical protein
LSELDQESSFPIFFLLFELPPTVTSEAPKIKEKLHGEQALPTNSQKKLGMEV